MNNLIENHAHHFIIPTPSVEIETEGVCKHCGFTRKMVNTMNLSEWLHTLEESSIYENEEDIVEKFGVRRKRTTTPIEVKLERRTDKTTSPHGCWIYASANSNIYATLLYQSKNRRVHYIAWSLANDRMAVDDLVVTQTCKSLYDPKTSGWINCINPAHLVAHHKYTKMQIPNLAV